MKRILAIPAAALLLTGCATIGISHERGGYADVSPTIANEMILDTPQIVVFDFRPPEQYAAAHIAGAISTPIDQIDVQLPLLVPYRSGTVLVYGDAKEDSIRGARVLVAAGFRNVVRIDGGLGKWIARGYQTVSSE